MKKIRKLVALISCFALFLGSAISVSAADLKDLFDAKYYSEKYSDLKAAFGDDEAALWNHYMTLGIKEGRVASNKFDVYSYRSRYADLENAFGDDWASYANHYVKYGVSEGRDGGGEFDAVSYANRYEDLKLVYGYNLDKLSAHFKAYGASEGRNAMSQSVIDAWEAAATEEDEDENLIYTETIFNPDGSYEVLVFENGKLKSHTQYNAAGKMKFYLVATYDAAGNFLEETITEYRDDGTVFVLRVTHTYNEKGLLAVRTEYHDGILAATTEFEYNGENQQVKYTDKDNFGDTIREVVFSYYASGMQKSVTSYRKGDSTRVEYVREFYENGYMKVERYYDWEGNLEFEAQYDEQGNLI